MSSIGTANGRAIHIDLPRLLETRALVQANSGGGKSWALRRLLEQTADQVQQLVIDPEGEFATLRERHDFVICAPHDADAIATPQTAALLARRLLESGVSAILDIYDLKAHERQLFVKRFLDALINAPKTLWHPVLIVLDEAHIFAPQTGSAESLGAVIDVATRGRKRGQCLVAATQRLSKLHKDVAAEMLNKLIGRTGLDVDVKRAADELGMGSREAMESLRALPPGTFYAFGPALAQTVQKVEIGPVRTTHPKSGQRLMAAPPAPSPAIRAKLAELADLQKDAEEEARTVEQLRAEVTTLKGRLTRAEKAAAAQGVPEADVQRRISAAVAQARAERPVQATACGVTDPKTRKALEQVARLVADVLQREGESASVNEIRPAPLVAPRQAPAPQRSNSGEIGGGLRRIMVALAQRQGLTNRQIGIRAQLSSKSGTFSTYLSKARSSGWIQDDGDRRWLTESGLAALGAFDPLPEGEALRDYWIHELGGGASRILQALCDAYPRGMSNAEVGVAANISHVSGTFSTYLSKLRSLELIQGGRGEIKASEELFG